VSITREAESYDLQETVLGHEHKVRCNSGAVPTDR